ncbi:site-specific DNA-methyltransferase [Sulfitobacter sp. M57]|uniref:DNA-methyltransferase n=1 Tax=unclassified Sulfitobacter TaxID=196795 RepID=UPI0023E1B76E|nr:MULTISPECIES: site-specific DNA-methyltransferase [unclassified Sulfitobacter]MDF3413268.1 site-specific DNA-methyltransferase [Sulfitobacter sp. KE5]MDF3421451.1 site-specific DNA-methyltransferase [Sulfitobacter sp. KE43]MDF3431815.1 site-specific DNA-methyltransferase [Sulfitobacter sp. KE42]MDF3457455.1 site-specific DNA-methyltransferase [Sulfitobacter sp. S74]MDF3461358.1 site-specific DNA-methyltransferase [Sulfitobacter sp. Ks18]
MGIQREVTIGNCRLILGDMREVLPLLDAKADLIVTDPPYLLTSGGTVEQSMGGMFAHEKYANDGALMDVMPWHEMGGPLFRACAANADCYVMSNDKNIFAAGGAFLGAGWQFHNLLVWDKVRATRNRWYMKNLEFTLYLWKGLADPKGINDCGSKQLFTLNAPKRGDHETEKPVPLFSHYVLNSSNQGDLVLDPFMGSGTTMLSCIETGRAGIGIEKEPRHFEGAVKSVTAAHLAKVAE